MRSPTFRDFLWRFNYKNSSRYSRFDRIGGIISLTVTILAYGWLYILTGKGILLGKEVWEGILIPRFGGEGGQKFIAASLFMGSILSLTVWAIRRFAFLIENIRFIKDGKAYGISLNNKHAWIGVIIFMILSWWLVLLVFLAVSGLRILREDLSQNS